MSFNNNIVQINNINKDYKWKKENNNKNKTIEIIIYKEIMNKNIMMMNIQILMNLKAVIKNQSIQEKIN